MATNTQVTTKDLEEMLSSMMYGFGNIFRLLGLGLWQLRHPNKLMITAAMALAGLLGGIFLFPQYQLLLCLGLPAMTVLVYGFQRQSDIEFYRKAFADVGFKGRDGRAPYLISKRDLGNHRTGCYFKSNISLMEWRKRLPQLQTALDCTILLVEQGQSQKVVHVVSIPADMELPTMLPWLDSFMDKRPNVIVLGESIAGQVRVDFNVTPHWVFAGSPGSGKSVLTRSLVYQCLVKGHKVYLMDFKQGVEFGKEYDNFCEVVMDKKRAVTVLSELVEENKRRLDEFRKRGIKNLDEYNAINKDDPMERIIIVIDELAILLIPTGSKDERMASMVATDRLENIAILGRAAGINLVLSLQRPDANTVTGQIKSNVAGRVCGYFADTAPSMIVLNNTRATEINSEIKGRFMFQDSKETIEMQGYYQKVEQVIEGLVNSRTERFTPKGNTPDLPINGKTPKLRRSQRRSEPSLAFDYDSEEDTA